MDRLRIVERVTEVAAGAHDAHEVRRAILHELREHVGCDAAVFRPGPTWSSSQPVYLDAETRVTDAYIERPERYRAELARWCELSRGSAAFVWEEVYSRSERSRMASQREILDAARLRTTMGCPLRFGGEIVGLVMLFRSGRVRPFSLERARDITRLLPAFGLVEAALQPRIASGDARLAEVLATLGARERQVAKLIARGLSSKEIARALGTSFHTVRNQTRRVFERLGVQSRAQLAARLRDR